MLYDFQSRLKVGKRFMAAPLVIVLGGNIGSGKTTTGELLAKRLNACYVPEPVNEWRQSGKLQAYYANPKERAFEFQTYTLQSRASALNARMFQWKHSHGGRAPSVVVMDRWLDDDMMFAKVNHARDGMSDAEFARYCSMHASLVKSFAGALQVKTVWLEASPQACLDRLRKRGRQEESSIPIDYLRELDAARPATDTSVQTEHVGAECVAETIASFVNTHWRPQLIVATGINGAIGRDGRLPWNCPEDLAFFRHMTIGKKVVVGRKTADAMGSLPGRDVIVISRSESRGITWEQFLRRHGAGLDASYVFCGGAEIYRLAMAENLVGRVIQTRMLNERVSRPDAIFERPDYFVPERVIEVCAMHHSE